MAASLDYRKLHLYVNKLRVDSLCVTGFLKETALKLSRKHGYSTLAPKHLPASIIINLDYRGRQAVHVYDDDRDLAIEVTKAIRLKMNSLGLELCDAVVEVKDARGRRISDHDVIFEFVSTPGAPAGLLSTEVRLRRIASDKAEAKLRGTLQQECSEECVWWQQELRKDPERWAGRLIVLVKFPMSGSSFVTRGDLKLREWSSFRGFWGWPGSRSDLTLGPVARQPATSSQAAAPAPTAKASRGVVPAPRAQLSWEQVVKQKKLKFRKEKGVLVSSVPAMLKFKKVDAKHVGEKVSAAKRRHKWSDREVFKAPRQESKKGGDEEWVATEMAMEKLYNSS
jgi:hypothetical protein